MTIYYFFLVYVYILWLFRSYFDWFVEFCESWVKLIRSFRLAPSSTAPGGGRPAVLGVLRVIGLRLVREPGQDFRFLSLNSGTRGGCARLWYCGGVGRCLRIWTPWRLLDGSGSSRIRGPALIFMSAGMLMTCDAQNLRVRLL